MTYKALVDLTRDEKLQLGAALVVRKKSLESALADVRGLQAKPVHPLNVTDATVIGKWNAVQLHVTTLVVNDSQHYTHEMRERALDRSRRITEFTIQIAQEQLAELADVLEQLF